LFEWFDHAGFVAIIVIVVLFLLFFFTVWKYIYRSAILKSWFRRESLSLKALLSGADQPSFDSTLYPCVRQGLGVPLMKACYESALKESTSGITSLSAIASTAPFIGLFGTIVSILQAFSGFKEGVTLSIVAPAISEALVVTAAGIFVAVPAYWAHLFLKRRAYEIANALKIQIDILTSRN
jgi:hypothetical protein